MRGQSLKAGFLEGGVSLKGSPLGRPKNLSVFNRALIGNHLVRGQGLKPWFLDWGGVSERLPPRRAEKSINF